MTPFDVRPPGPETPEPASFRVRRGDGARGILPDAAAEAFERDGVVCLEGALGPDVVRDLRGALDRAVEAPSPLGYRVERPGEPGFFFTEYNLWQRMPEVRRVAFESPVADLAGSLMRSRSVTLYFDNVFVKEAGSRGAVVPWHEDAMFLRMDGLDVVNFWIALDPVPRDCAVVFKRGSHRRPDPVYRALHFDPDQRYPDPIQRDRVPMPPFEKLDAAFPSVARAAAPGDAFVFTQRTLHASAGNRLATRRRALGFLLLGDGATFNGAPGTSDPPFRGEGLVDGGPPQCASFPRLR